MNPLPNRVDVRADSYRTNYEENLAAVETLCSHLKKAREGGGEKYTKRHLARGKLLPRQRIDMLLDRDSPFLELCPLAGVHEHGKVPGGSVIAGIGFVHGRECMLSASEATVQGGAIGPTGLKKSGRIGEIARENDLIAIHCIESAGADLPNQAEIFVPGGAGFREITRRSADRMPTISLVFGSCTAGGAYIPGMSDYVVMVKEAAYMYLAILRRLRATSRARRSFWE